MHHRTQRVLLLGAFTTAAGLGAVAYDQAAAHASDKPPAVEQPGGLLDTVTEPVEDVADEVLPAPEPDEPELEQPADEPKPDKATEPAPAPPADQPPALPTEPIGDIVDDIEDGLDDIGEVITDPPLPVPAPTQPLPMPVLTPEPTEPTDPITVTLPPLDPAPPADAPAPAVPVAAPLPVVIGPLPAIGVGLDGTPVPQTPRPVAAATVDAPLCDDHGQPVADVVRQLIGSLTGKTAAAKSGEPAKPCPGTPAAPAEQATGMASMKPPSPYGGDLTGDVTLALGQPELARLEHLRARSHMPDGRTLSVEPGPA